MSKPEALTNELSDWAWSFADFTLDVKRSCLLLRGQEVKLRPKSFDTLKYLVENSGRLVTKTELIQAVWPDSFVTDDSLVQCLRDVRRALGDEQQEFIKTVARRGYLFDKEVIRRESTANRAIYAEEVEGVRVVIEAGRTQSAQDQPHRRQIIPGTPEVAVRRLTRGQKTVAVSLALLGFFALLSYLWLRPNSEPQPAGSSKPRSIAVLPFKPLGPDAADEYLGLGMADTLITKLSNIRQIIVRPTSAVHRYISSDQDSLAAGREQRVDAVLEGSIQRSGNKVRVTVRLMDVRDGSALWAYKCDEYCADIFAVQDTISEKVAGALALKLSGAEKQGLAKRYTDNTEAYQLYIKGVFLRNQMTDEGLKKSIECFRQAIELDPEYALAYAGQASSYSPLAYLGYIPVRDAELKNKPLIIKALELDDTLAEAHVSLAELKLFVEWDWEGAEREFKRAIELNPNEQLAHLLYAALLMAVGRSGEALAESKLALANDPLSPRAGFALGRMYFLAGQYDQAIEQGTRTRELFPNYSLINLGPCYERKGMYEQAVKEYLDAEARSGMRAEEIAALRQAYVNSGWRGYLQKRLDLAKAEAKRKPTQSILLAELYAHLSEKDQAIKYLEGAYQERNMSLIFLNIDPTWEGLRSDPRFALLVARMRLAR